MTRDSYYSSHGNLRVANGSVGAWTIEGAKSMTNGLGLTSDKLLDFCWIAVSALIGGYAGGGV